MEPESADKEAVQKLMDSPQLDENPPNRWRLEEDAPQPTIPSSSDADSTPDVADTGVPSTFAVPELEVLANSSDESTQPSDALRHRPPMRRINFARPPPVQQPPPPPIPLQSNATDSLSLLQLKKLVSDFPQHQPTAYDFTYEDAASYPEELEEWFSYSESEKSHLWRSRVAFEQAWEKFKMNGAHPEPLRGWISASFPVRKKFVREQVHLAESADLKKRVKALGRLVYIALGTWRETAGLKGEDGLDFKHHGTTESVFDNSTVQIKWIRDGVELICEAMGAPIIFDAFRSAMSRPPSKSSTEIHQNGADSTSLELEAMEQSFTLTLMYFIVETGRMQFLHGFEEIRDEIVILEPDLLVYLAKTLAKLRWSESNSPLVIKLSLLFWKSLLLVFGESSTLDEMKKALSEPSSEDTKKSVISASPLDYHLFRQEITSKYPAYNPPPPLLPLELENSSILPPLTHSSRSSTVSGQIGGVGPTRFSDTGNSILQQPVHIATPAPSPPPSPAGPGGKAGKKQNYQTNQNFPFLYPPLDASSNGAGGKGGSGLQELLVGKKWEGSDIPTSILEAGDLFAKRTRMTRALRQLWQERERFMKFDRGWDSASKAKSGLNELQEIQRRLEELGIEAEKDEAEKSTSQELPHILQKDLDMEPHLSARLNFIDKFYRESIPHLQSLVIVLLKEVLANVTQIVNQPSTWSPSGLGPSFQDSNGEPNRSRQPEASRQPNGSVANGLFRSKNKGPNDLATIDALRQREISSKAVSGCIVTLLKWFKVSHVLKYEYLAQLLLDSNYLPLVLKLFAHQDLDRAVESKADKPSLGFFAYCWAHSSHQPDSRYTDLEESSEDEAIPPPIRLARNEASSATSTSFPQDSAEPRRPPEVDELGLPTTDIPGTPIAVFSWRNLFSAINLLKIMQKVVRHKTHRNLLLVHYKSSTILRKVLKVPQPELRLYALKLFKGQVPYCGRKWRQSNMRVITAVYLHVPPELRDDWLAGGDVDSEVEEALPLEQALRALTHWWHCTRYPEQMGAGEGLLESEVDFFARELDKMDWGFGDEGAEEMAREQWEGQGQGQADNNW